MDPFCGYLGSIGGTEGTRQAAHPLVSCSAILNLKPRISPGFRLHRNLRSDVLSLGLRLRGLLPWTLSCLHREMKHDESSIFGLWGSASSFTVEGVECRVRGGREVACW